ncbi:MAG: hypothetical protein V3S64_09440 [bacterium]
MEKQVRRHWDSEERKRLGLEIIQEMLRYYEPGQDRIITPDNVYQEGRPEGREVLEAFMDRLLEPGSAAEGLEHLEQCLGDLEAGLSILFLSEHRGNFDVPSFNNLIKREDPRFGEILKRIIYIAGRKLNESSDLVKMFTEKYSRLVIVPRREYPRARPGETKAEIKDREAFEHYAARINRAAFRQMLRLRKSGYIFVLYPLGGRLKFGADNVPVRETVSYLSRFDRAYLVSMEGNTLPIEDRMEDERPLPDKVIFRFGAPLDTKAFLADQQRRFEQERAQGNLPEPMDTEQYTVNRIMTMLENLRLTGTYDNQSSL